MNNRALILEPKHLQNILSDPDLLIIDLSRKEVYHTLHIPGAIHVDSSELISGIYPALGKLPDKEQLQKLFSRIGLSADKHVVVYDDEGGGWAGRFIWTLDVISHKKYSYLNGGILAWKNESYPIQQQNNETVASDYQFSLNRNPIAELQEVINSLSDDNTIIWDARSREEYTGIKVFAAKGGHIPGAKNYEWIRGMDRENNLRMKNPHILKQELQEAGIDLTKNIITHCQTHHRSGFTYLIGLALGLNIKAYHGSWSEWGNHPDTPVEK